MNVDDFADVHRDYGCGYDHGVDHADHDLWPSAQRALQLRHQDRALQAPGLQVTCDVVETCLRTTLVYTLAAWIVVPLETGGQCLKVQKIFMPDSRLSSSLYFVCVFLAPARGSL